jgi:hypothetical protein
MISILLFLTLICCPDGVKSDNKGKNRGTEKLSEPPKGKLVIAPGSTPQNNTPVSEEQIVIQKQGTPAVTNLQAGLSSALTPHLIYNSDTTQKSVTEPFGNLKWEP